MMIFVDSCRIYGNMLSTHPEMIQFLLIYLTIMIMIFVRLGWENFQTRIKFLGLCLFQKIHLQETRPLIRKCKSELDYAKKYLTRSKGGYSPYPNYGVRYKNSFLPYITGLWNNLNVST